MPQTLSAVKGRLKQVIGLSLSTFVFLSSLFISFFFCRIFSLTVSYPIPPTLRVCCRFAIQFVLLLYPSIASVLIVSNKISAVELEF